MDPGFNCFWLEFGSAAQQVNGLGRLTQRRTNNA
jgi:hypothetical protein